jgi:hypothetical protein
VECVCSALDKCYATGQEYLDDNDMGSLEPGRNFGIMILYTGLLFVFSFLALRFIKWEKR